MSRGMMKWAPYQSLTEQTIYLNKSRTELKKVAKPTISSDIAEQINYELVNYHGQLVKIKFFESGTIIEIKCVIKKIDAFNKCLFIDNNRIDFKNLLLVETI